MVYLLRNALAALCVFASFSWASSGPLAAAEEFIPPSEWLSRDTILQLAKETDEIQHIYHLLDHLDPECLETQVLRPCDTDWVTCVEDAWVVEAVVQARCVPSQDGRLAVRLLMDAIHGNVISRFPEKDYFESPIFCRESYDCVVPQDSETCRNFIYAQIEAVPDPTKVCECVAQACRRPDTNQPSQR